jgi:transcriptional regulator with XRE-family HTH domain
MNAARLCRSCGARLRTGNAGIYCSSCARAGRFAVPEGFYDSLELRAAVASYDFGTVFRAVRARTGMSQLHLAGMIGLSQSRISSVERGERRLRDVSLIARIAAALEIPGQLLGFRPGLTEGGMMEAEVSWVDRRDFLTLVTAATLGSSLHPEIERLSAILPSQAEPVSRQRIGDADVDAIEAITEGFRRSELAHGGGLCRSAAVAQLQQVQRLRDATCSENVRARLILATSELAQLAAWMAYDVEDHDAARRLWTFALDASRHAEDHPRSTDLAVAVLGNMSTQALHLDRPEEALRFTQLASTTASNWKHPASAITYPGVLTGLGFCRGAMGEIEPCRRAMGQQAEEWAKALDTAPPWHWTRHAPQEQISGFEAEKQGVALELLSRTHSEFAPSAIDNLTVAVDNYDQRFARPWAIMLHYLAAAHFRAGNVDTGVETGQEAIHSITALSGRRGYTKLRIVDAAAAPFTRNPEVAELREHIRTTLATAA